MDESGFGSASAAVSANVAEVDKQIEKLMKQIDDNDNTIEQLEMAIEQLEMAIKQLEMAIKQLEMAIATAALEERTELRKKEFQLLDKQSQLRNKELQLRDEKLLLLKQNNVDSVSAKQESDRLIGIDFRIVDQELKHNFDLKRFMIQVNQLFQWWEEEKEFGFQNYMAPYFPCVQSSGMGKTKLLREAHMKFLTDGEKKNRNKG